MWRSQSVSFLTTEQWHDQEQSLTPENHIFIEVLSGFVWKATLAGLFQSAWLQPSLNVPHSQNRYSLCFLPFHVCFTGLFPHLLPSIIGDSTRYQITLFFLQYLCMHWSLAAERREDNNRLCPSMQFHICLLCRRGSAPVTSCLRVCSHSWNANFYIWWNKCHSFIHGLKPSETMFLVVFSQETLGERQRASIKNSCIVPL